MTKKTPQPRVWINVTTSANWTRPAVGIVRVERALALHLRELMGIDQCRLCTWQDERFIEWAPATTPASALEDRALEALVPRGPSFDLVRPFLTRALRRYGGEATSVGKDVVRLDIPLAPKSNLQPGPGDFLISIGLDWDMQYTARFHGLATRQGLRIITCCYDLIPVLFPHYCVGEVAKRFTEYFLDLSWGSEAVLCISEQTRRDYTELCTTLGAPRRKSVVIPMGDNIPTGEDVLSEPVLAATKQPFILFVSTIERRKNHEVLYRAYHLLARQGKVKSLPKLVFVGMPGWGVGDLMKDIELDPLTRGLIIQLNHVSDGELSYLYKKALFCVFPSLYEGWGLPVGEALAMGKAVIASGEGSLPEVGGDLVRYVPAWNAYAWADAISEYISNPDLVAEAQYRIQSEYKPRQWVDMAARVLDLVLELHAETPAPVVLLPGYHQSTFCGVHEGPAIVATGNPGLLLFGPHRALSAGAHTVDVAVRAGEPSKATLRFSVVSRAATVVHATATQSLDRAESGAVLTVSIPLHLDADVADLEIKCDLDGPAHARIEQITITSARALSQASTAGRTVPEHKRDFVPMLNRRQETR